MPKVATQPTPYPHLLFAFLDELTASRSEPIRFTVPSPAVQVEIQRTNCRINNATVLSIKLIREGDDEKRIECYSWTNREASIGFHLEIYFRSIPGNRWVIDHCHNQPLPTEGADVADDLTTILSWVNECTLGLPGLIRAVPTC